MTTPAPPFTPDMAKRLGGTPLLLLLDIDGTLSPIALRPGDAVVPPETQTLLRALADRSSVLVAAISGRAADDARRMLGVDGAWIIGNHGMEIAPPGAPAAVRDDVAAFVGKITEACRRAAEALREYDGVIVEDKRWTLSVHYRRASRDAVPAVQRIVGEIAASLGLKLTQGKEVLEIRPPLDIHKGSAAVALAESLGADESAASVFAAGDDRTDEDMFRALRARLPQAVTVRVGESGETAAEYRVADPARLRELLEALLASRR